MYVRCGPAFLAAGTHALRANIKPALSLFGSKVIHTHIIAIVEGPWVPRGFVGRLLLQFKVLQYLQDNGRNHPSKLESLARPRYYALVQCNLCPWEHACSVLLEKWNLRSVYT